MRCYGRLQVSWWRRRVAEVMPERMPDRAVSADHAVAVNLPDHMAELAEELLPPY